MYFVCVMLMSIKRQKTSFKLKKSSSKKDRARLRSHVSYVFLSIIEVSANSSSLDDNRFSDTLSLSSRMKTSMIRSAVSASTFVFAVNSVFNLFSSLLFSAVCVFSISASSLLFEQIFVIHDELRSLRN